MTAQEHIAKLLNMGKYGENLAAEILDDHSHELAQKLRTYAWGKFQGFDDEVASLALTLADMIDPKVETRKLRNDREED
jgi:hypothetical protein